MPAPYKTFDTADLNNLRALVPEERVIPGAEVGEDYCHDELSGIRKRPDVLIKAMSAEEDFRGHEIRRCTQHSRDSRAARARDWSEERFRSTAASCSTSAE